MPGPIAAQRAFALTAEDDAGTVYARSAELAAELLDEVLPSPTFAPQEGEPTYAAKIEAADRELDLSRPEESLNRIRALSPHIGARGELNGRRVTIWRARLEDGGSSRSRCSRRAGSGCRTRHGCAACGEHRAGAGCGVRGRPPRLRGGRLRRPRAPLGRRRSSTTATGRSRGSSRSGRCSASARSTTRSRRSASGPCASSTRRCWRRCASAPTSSASSAACPDYAAVERVGRARPACPARAGRALHERRAPAGRRRDRAAAARSCPEGPLKHSYPDWVWDVWRRDLGEERALALMRAQNEPPPVVVRHVRGQSPDGSRDGHPGRLRGRAGRRGRPRTRRDLAPEPRLAARRPRRRLPGRESASSISARRPAARRRCSRARSSPSRRTRRVRASCEENVDRLGAENVRVVHADGRYAPGGADRLRPRARRRTVLRPRRPRHPPRPPLALAAAARAPARAPPRRGGARSARRHDRLLRLHDQRGRGGSAWWTRPAWRSSRSRAGRSSGTRGGPSSCRRTRTSTDERLLHRPPPGRVVGSPRGLARLGADGRDRAVALRGGLLAPRRADRAPDARAARASSTSTSATATSSRP